MKTICFIKRYLFIFGSLLFLLPVYTQSTLYFPPIAGDTWEKTTPQSLGWKTELLPELKTYLESVHTKGFIVLKDGKMVLEYYLNGHDVNKFWYWASAGKSLTSVIVAIAESEKKLSIQDSTAKFLGNWTSCNSTDQSKIKIIHQLTMTSGLDEKFGFDCLEPSCLKCLAAPGTRWSYHNGPYTLLDGVIENATGQKLNTYFKNKLGDKIGMNGLYIFNDANNVFYSTTRSMARFGLMVLAKGRWNDQVVVNHPDYIQNMSQSSQSLNPSYGYLWWLNGKDKHMLPGFQIVYKGPLVPEAPKDMFAALGKNDQKLYIVPSQNLVIVRLGELATESNTPVPVRMDSDLWRRLSDIMKLNTGTTTRVKQHRLVNNAPTSWVSQNVLHIDENIAVKKVHIYKLNGHLLTTITGNGHTHALSLSPGIYIASISDDQDHVSTKKFIIY